MQLRPVLKLTRFPAHEHISGASKIPTIIYYDRSGKVKAVGAEAQREGIFEMAEDEQWIKSEWCNALSSSYFLLMPSQVYSPSPE